MLGNEKQNPLNLYPSNVALPNQRTVEYRDLSWLCFQCIYSLFGQHQGSFFNVQFAGGLEREFQNWSKLETILCWFQFTCWFETNSHSVSFLVCQLVWVGLWDGGVRWAVVQLCSWVCAVGGCQLKVCSCAVGGASWKGVFTASSKWESGRAASSLWSRHTTTPSQ